MDSMIRLGIMGFVEGNGHPYSWSAICNGYDPVAMEQSGFPTISHYLAERKWPNDRLANVSVTHVWTQDAARSRHIARAALIENVVSKPEDMIGKIDGLLLARDDTENHPMFAAPFLQSGIPVYLDKAPALSVANFDRLFERELKAGIIFAGSTLRFAQEFQLTATDRSAIGPIRHISAVTPNTWDRYAIHVIEPALNLIGNVGEVVRGQNWSAKNVQSLDVEFEAGISAHFAAVGGALAPIAIRVFGERNWRDLVFKDAFSCFRAALAEFVGGIRDGASRLDIGFTRRVVDLIERGRS
jgi:predicted dehydrogenase